MQIHIGELSVFEYSPIKDDIDSYASICSWKRSITKIDLLESSKQICFRSGYILGVSSYDLENEMIHLRRNMLCCN